MPRRILDLNGHDWQLGPSPPEASPHEAVWSELDRVCKWLPARVPGNVRASLVEAGRLPELNLGLAPEGAQWVDDHCWWFVRTFKVSSPPNTTVHLVLHGVDYISDVFMNGQPLGHHEGMFSPQVYDVSGLLANENRLAVRILGSRWLPKDRSTRWEQLLSQLEARLGSMPGRFPHRRDTLKCQMGFGWDFAPPLRTMGIWDDVHLVVSDGVYLRRVLVRQQTRAEGVTLTLRAEVDSPAHRLLVLRCTLIGETFQGEPVFANYPLSLEPGTNRCDLELDVPQPQLWWPWDHGHPNLYRLTVELCEGTAVLDSVTESIGLRTVELDGWTLRVNGQPIYGRGANWVPADILPGRVTNADYRALLTCARQANMNMLRVWGGGLREKRAFYDLCDRMGLLVWQEFPFACAFLTRFPRTQDYLRLVESEVRAIVDSLQNHPCVLLWCGGNEFAPQRNGPLVSVLRRTVSAAEPDRPFLAASPAGGDRHSWQVWHHYRPPAAYLKDRADFASEFGLQAPPDEDALRRFIPADDLWPPGPAWATHGAQWKKLWRYALPFLEDSTPSLGQFIKASQQAQAHGLQLGIEHFRRRKAAGCGGALVWQLNEPWPAISWALLDYYRRPKPAFEVVARCFSPLLVTVEFAPKHYRAGDQFSGRIWIINDLPETFAACRVDVVLWDGEGQIAGQFERMLDLAAHSVEMVGSLGWTLPAGGGWRLTGRLAHGEQEWGANEYDLSACDELQPTLWQRLRAWLAARVAHA